MKAQRVECCYTVRALLTSSGKVYFNDFIVRSGGCAGNTKTMSADTAGETSTAIGSEFDFSSLHQTPRDEQVQNSVAGAIITDALVMDGVMKNHETLAGQLESGLKENEHFKSSRTRTMML